MKEGKVLARVWMVVIFSGALLCLYARRRRRAGRPASSPNCLSSSSPLLPNDIWPRQHEEGRKQTPPLKFLFFPFCGSVQPRSLVR